MSRVAVARGKRVDSGHCSLFRRSRVPGKALLCCPTPMGQKLEGVNLKGLCLVMPKALTTCNPVMSLSISRTFFSPWKLKKKNFSPWFPFILQTWSLSLSSLKFSANWQLCLMNALHSSSYKLDSVHFLIFTFSDLEHVATAKLPWAQLALVSLRGGFSKCQLRK